MRIGVDGADVYCYTGTRPVDPARATVVFVHGAANDHSVFALQSRYFAHHGRNVLAVDLPGHGRSAGPPQDSVEAIADWIVRLLDAAAIRESALVGHSLGALAALEAASRHPSRISRVALLGPAFPMAVSDVLIDAARAGDHAAFELIAGWSHSPGKQLCGNPVPGMWMMGGALRLMERSAPGALFVDLRACNAYANGLAAASAVRCPTLLVLGARDLMAPPKAALGMIDALAEKRVITLADCGHAMMAEQPDAVLDALAAFL
jgi:pimeloyl-ACP methyl ester carboxylesterase